MFFYTVFLSGGFVEGFRGESVVAVHLEFLPNGGDPIREVFVHVCGSSQLAVGVRRLHLLEQVEEEGVGFKDRQKLRPERGREGEWRGGNPFK